MNTKLHAITDQSGRPLSFFMTAGQISDYTGAAALLDSLPAAQWMLGDRGYDADWFKDWRQVTTRYDRRPTVFFSTICLAATVMFWL